AGSVVVASDNPDEGQRSIGVTLTIAGLAIAQTDDATVVAETGTTDSVSVALELQPATDVVLTVTSSDEGEATVSPATLTFTAENWSTPQWVTVTGVDDDEIDGQQTSVITIAVDTEASDASYGSLPAQTVEVTTADNEAGGLSVTETDGGTVVSEGGSTDELRVALVSQPTADVVLTVTSSDEGEVTVSPATLTFTAANWSTVQAVTVTGVDDDEVDGNQTSTVTVAVDAGLSDDAWDAVAAVAIEVTTVDDDAGGGVSESAPAGHPGVSTDQLVASYDLSSLTPAGLLRDFSGNDLHGTITGTTPVAGVRGGARDFRGRVRDGRVADMVELPAQPVFDLDGPFSVAAWFYFYKQFQHQHIVACNDKFTLWITEQDHMRFANSRGDYAEMTVRVSPNEFHSVSAVFRGTVGDVIDDSTVEIWIDGVRQLPLEYGSDVTDPPVWRDGILHPTDACHIGFESHQGQAAHQLQPFYGVIDEVIVFGRALTPEEVALLALTQD
ncbi:MAG TPA: LamG-like jellyroll fold domain-containing protein, partial [Longimicrobiales bacterium]|nr:LamG-like jellyroll fold domain-containing protein [Longimicrobiales bacterium]